MASIIVSDVSRSFTRGVIGDLGINQIPFFGKRISSFAGNYVDGLTSGFASSIDAKIFGTKTTNRTRGSRLNDLQVQSSAYGEFINQVFGTARLAGNVIWSTNIKEAVNITAVNSAGGGKGGGGTRVTKQTETRYTYSVNLAIALCEGEIDEVLRVWADTKIINPLNYSIAYRVYKGTETQLPDSLIEANIGIGKTPAYRNMAYVVFEDFQLAEFGNRIPNFTFEVKKNYKNSISGTASAEELVKCVNLIPATGEFVYDTKIQNKILGTEFTGLSGEQIVIQAGKQQRINHNTHHAKADIVVALDDLQRTFPNLEYVSIVCAWFGDNIDANLCKILPAVEQKVNITTTPDSWQVGSYNRGAARQISLDVNGRPNYGGTPSDSSILNLVSEIKARGLKVMFYPMIFMDVTGKPWRGHLTCTAAQAPNFFTKSEGYNNFIMHYANLLYNKVDAFIIGSEMKGLTSIMNTSNQFPAVSELVNLAGLVKSVMAPATKISYAADWSEYHSVNGWFNMDSLWASSNIDFIGIDAYFPLTDLPQNNNYNVQQIVDGWTNGEGYDWYYTDTGRTNQATLQAKYAWKNMAYWWGNTHQNPNGSYTSWVPNSKKIWFTEYGFPSTDGAANQPNVFYNPDSVDGGLPRFSKGQIDYQAQRTGIEATEIKWQGSSMIENKFLWCFDARPFPYWPDLKDVWSDGNLYQLGHFVNGKLGTSGLSEVLKYLCIRAGIAAENIDVSEIKQKIDGFVLNSNENIFDIIKTLSTVYFFNVIEDAGKIKFTVQPQNSFIEIADNDVLFVNGKSIINAVSNDIQKATIYDFAYLSKNNNYLSASARIEDSSTTLKNQISDKIPIALETAHAQMIAEVNLLKEQIEADKIFFGLNSKYAYLNVGDEIKISGKNYIIEQIDYEASKLTIAARRYEAKIYDLNFNQYDRKQITQEAEEKHDLVTYILDLPVMPDNTNDELRLYFACSSLGKFNGAEIYASNDNGISYNKLTNITMESVIGTALNILPPSSEYIFDDKSYLDVSLISGELESKNLLNILNHANIALVGNELIQFKNAELIGENKFRLKNLLRGCFGTENKIPAHAEFERFILYDSRLTHINANEHYIGQNIKYKIVPAGKTILEVSAIDFVFNANSLKPFSPVNVTHNFVTNDIHFNWVRRARKNGGLRNQVEVPLAENSENYEIEIYDNSMNLKRTAKTSTQSYIYTAVMQISDFGSLQTSLKTKVYQLSETIGRGTEKLYTIL